MLFSEMLRAEVDEAVASVSDSIVNQRGPRCGVAEWRKAIPESRDRLQSKLLVWCVAPMLAGLALFMVAVSTSSESPDDPAVALRILGLSLTFGIVVWGLRAATLFAAVCGSMICLVVTLGTWRKNEWHSELLPLMALFSLTFAATRLGRGRKTRMGLAEDKRGRRASQIIANLGAASLSVGAGMVADARALHTSTGFAFSVTTVPVLVLAAFCEATADTVSSEIGQAFGGRPILLTTLRRVPTGTDGAVTLLGTAAGILASGVVAATGLWAIRMTWKDALVAMLGGTAGLFFDTVLGATLERRGWLGNDLVNFTSTVFAVVAALGLAIMF
jgi:uncharacterized protein (TIGR00297 family)